LTIGFDAAWRFLMISANAFDGLPGVLSGKPFHTSAIE
jgi:hypothetical protein